MTFAPLPVHATVYIKILHIFSPRLKIGTMVLARLDGCRSNSLFFNFVFVFVCVFVIVYMCQEAVNIINFPQLYDRLGF